MNRKRLGIGLAGALLLAITAVGFLAVSAEYGSQSDPLVTLSYINDVLVPDTLRQVDLKLAAKQNEFDTSANAKINELNAAADAKISAIRAALQGGTASDALIDSIADAVIVKMGQGGTSQDANWKVVTIPAGKTLTGDAGCQVVLRSGGATCVASGSPGLINLTTAESLANGGSLQANSLYLISVDGRGVKAGSSGATVLASGSYVIK